MTQTAYQFKKVVDNSDGTITADIVFYIYTDSGMQEQEATVTAANMEEIKSWASVKWALRH